MCIRDRSRRQGSGTELFAGNQQQGQDGNIIGPKILGKSIGVSALWVLVAIVIGGDLLGVCLLYTSRCV